MEVKNVRDKTGESYILVTQDENSNNCWANCTVMAIEETQMCLADHVGRVRALLVKYAKLTANGGAMSFENIVQVCMGEALRAKKRENTLVELGVLLQHTHRKGRPAIVGLMRSTNEGRAAHVIVSVGCSPDGTYLFLDPLAAQLAEVPAGQLSKYVTNYGTTWDFLGNSIIFH